MPACQRHDVNYRVVVQYHSVDNVAVSQNTHNHAMTAWQTHVVDDDGISMQLTLSSELSYQVLVKSQTSAGFNTSLHVQPIYITTHSV